MNRQQLIDLMKDGKTATVTFTKRTTGETRVMNCRLGVTKHLKGGTKPYDDAEKNVVSVYDMQKKAYRNISVENIISVKAKGKTYV